MKMRNVLAFLICFALLLTTGIGWTQVISPVPISSQPPMEMLFGLIGKYLAIAGQYEMLVDKGQNPNSAIKVRIAAKLDISNTYEESDLGSILSGVSKVAFWINGNMFLKYPSTSLFELSGSLGNIEILTTKDKSIVTSPDEGVYSVLQKAGNLRTVAEGLPFGDLADVPLTIDELKFLIVTLLPGIANFDNEYEGIRPTPKGMAHVIKLASVDGDLNITLWILDKTWDLYKADIYDAGDGSVAVITFERIDLVAAVPDSEFSVDTSSMTELSYENLIEILNLKFASFILSGVPIVADLYPSLPKVNKGDEIEIISNALDAENEESDLTPLIEYRSPNGSWMPLAAEYIGISPLGNWKAVWTPKLSDPLGDYNLRVAYVDKSGSKSETFELLKAFKVVAIPPIALSFLPKGEGISIKSTIVVTFDQDMDRVAIEKAFSATYSSGEKISGVFQWSGKTLTFIPSESLKYGSTCNIRIAGTAKANNGLGLDVNKNGIAEGSPRDDLSFKFRVEGALIVSAIQSLKRSEVVKGDFVVIDIVIENVTRLSQFSFDLIFNPSVLKVSKIEPASFTDWRPKPKDIKDMGEADIWLPTIIDNDKGFATISVSKTRFSGVSGTGILATITFEAIGSGESGINFKNASFANILDEILKPILQGTKLTVSEFMAYDTNQDGVVDIFDFIKGAPAEPLVNKLGDSFPNPMNPDTWIPFNLADSGDVVIRIYSSKGQLVRMLDLGYKNPGSYATRSNSAYWDGKDDNGQPVSSGLYFYNIKAGNFTATKKMIVLK
ncbi:MAG: Ig-like domain-containing protein [Candidatus Poribacteria bacterium]